MWSLLNTLTCSQEGVHNRSTQTVWEDVISSIHDSIVRDKLPKSWAGAEWWVQVAMQTSLSVLVLVL